jgi:uncharacterized membrane protein
MTYSGETNLRSLLKGITWRITGTLDTILLTFIVTGQLKVAFQVGLFESVTKIALYYIHERVWNRIKWSDDRKLVNLKFIIKSISWRVSATIDTILISYFFTGNIGNALQIGGLELFTKIFLFYMHEYLWNCIVWGRRISFKSNQNIIVREIEVEDFKIFQLERKQEPISHQEIGSYSILTA